MDNIYLLKICKINGEQILSTETYGFETEEQINEIVNKILKDPNNDVGKNPGTLLFKENINFFKKEEKLNVNVSDKQNNSPLNMYSKGKALPWIYKRPFH